MSTYRLTDTTGIVVTLTGATQDAAHEAARGLAFALRRRVDITPATPIVSGVTTVTGWSAYPSL